MKSCSWLCVILLLFAAHVVSAESGEAVFLDQFDSASQWSGLPGIQLKIAQYNGDPCCLHVRGIQPKAWNYVRSETFSLEGGKKYRLSARVAVKLVTPAVRPFLKLEFMTAVERGRTLGRASTSTYDVGVAGWQDLVGEFEAPAEAGAGWIALEKGTNSPVEIDAYLGQVKLVEIEEFARFTELRFEEPPQPLEKLKGVHPRLYLTAERIEKLKKLIKDDAKYAALFAEIKALTDQAVRRGPPKYRQHDSYSGDEQLWQRDVGNGMPYIAIVYLLTEEPDYLEAAKQLMLASCGYETWGLGRIDGSDLATGHQLYGLALSYDWLYHDLDAQTLKTVRDCLIRRAGFMFEKAVNEQIWWHDAYLQNHLWVNTAGLAATGFALYGEVDDVDGWINLPLAKFTRTVRALGPDGASHEGVPYWTYGLEYLLKFMDMARDLLGVDLFEGSEWFENTAYFRLYASLPRDSWRRDSSLMTYADGPRYDWYGPDYMLRKLASEYKDGHAQWLADELDEANVCHPSASFLNLLWYDPSVDAQGPGELPTFRHFDDMDLVYMRSDWSGDESLCSFKCGPHIGHEAVRQFSFDPGSGHVHPDAGAFQIFAYGDWLSVDDGYTLKTTETQNTALINGIGQTGSGGAWFNGSTLCAENRGARIVTVESMREMDYVIGDVTDAYEKKAGVKKFVRQFYFIKPDVWIVVDRLEAAGPAEFELFLHSDWPFEKASENEYRLVGKSGEMSVFTVAPGDASVRGFKQPFKGTDGKPKGTIDALSVRNKDKSEVATFINVLCASRKGGENPVVSIESPDDIMRIKIQNNGHVRRIEIVLGAIDFNTPVLKLNR